MESELFHDGIENQARDDLGIVDWRLSAPRARKIYPCDSPARGYLYK